MPGVVGLVGRGIGDLGEGEETQHPDEGSRRPECKTRWPMPATTALLSGLRVLDLSIWRPGPYATSLLVPLGADVLKVEPPGGDPMRRYPGLFAAVNTGKRSIELDLKVNAGRARALALAEQADVLVEGFRPGVMARLGLDDAAVRARNPGIVYCSISGYGQQGRARRPPRPRRELPGVGRGAHPRGRLGHRPAPADGRPGVRADRRLRDLCRRRRPGRQRRGDLPRRLHDRRDGHVDGSVRRGRRPARGQRPSGPVPGYGLFATADGRQVSLGVVNEQHFWSALCRELGLDDAAGSRLRRTVRSGRRAATRHRRCRRRPRPGRAGRRARPVPASRWPRCSTGSRCWRARRSRPSPIRLPLPDTTREVPALDQHRGEGFCDRA